jgi:hypothetical protein
LRSCGSSSGAKGQASVEIAAPLAASVRTHSPISLGSSSGSSACTFTTISSLGSPSRSTASAMRLVPLSWGSRVRIASPPNPRTAAITRASSVATTTRCTVLEFSAAW